jgi:CRISPR-associated protein (TIGR02584 family)
VADLPETPRTVLLALLGMSPAVLTETLWALAQEHPRVLPDEVIVVTTGRGRRALVEEVLESGVWARLRQQVACALAVLRLANVGHHVRVVPGHLGEGELEDVVTAADNAVLADFLLETVRQFTECPEVRLVVSIAGGRKTMSLLMGTAVGLLGRAGDRLCHVLVAPPFDSPRLEPRFYFPDASVGAYRVPGEERPLAPEEARLTLAEIPFVPLRYLFGKQFDRTVGGFMATVEAIRRQVATGTDWPTLALDPRCQRCVVNDVPVKLGTLEFALLWWLAERRRSGQPPLPKLRAIQGELGEFLRRQPLARYPQRALALAQWEKRETTPDDWRKTVSALRQKLRRAVGPAVAALCDPVQSERPGEIGLRLPLGQIMVTPGELTTDDEERAQAAQQYQEDV